MHAVIINGSPRVSKHSNTERIIDSFAEGLALSGASYERYAISDKDNWDSAREAYIKNTEIIIALPLYVECVPGILLEFLETLPVKDETTRISFILQGGFAEAKQLECGKAFLDKLPGYLGVSYGGTLIKGDNFGIRVLKESEVQKIITPYRNMGKAFVDEDGFKPETVKKFAGPEIFSLPIRLMLQLMFMTLARKNYRDIAKGWGCKVPIDYRPWSA
ncbi:hypothetical protein BXO88_14615 [Oribacterium sp. C9]|uniref:hypothetical protein n=1 Tax=Oribacterium sp. C9 TaxID=1943579 RepID=UPI00098F8470|nr:hypothetical protein [Oribacterium sp. C9]OON84958.1 hypothetical protein BXO88_14615 [Oribacterium sp. C9]